MFSLPRMSGLPFELLLALRYLRPKRTFVSVITLISVLGVTLGVAVLIIVISVMSGFDRHMRDVILSFSPHLTITPRGGNLKNYQTVMKTIAANREVKVVAPFVAGQVLMETQTNANHVESLVSAPRIMGINPELEQQISIRPTNIIEGTFDVSGHGLIVGTAFADGMKLEVGDRVSIYSPHELRKMQQSRGKENQEVVLPDD